MKTQSNIVAPDFDGLPKGFRAAKKGIYVNRKGNDADGEAEWVWLCSPLKVLALTRDGSGAGWGRLVELVDPDGTPHRIALPSRLFAGDGAEMRSLLLDHGMRLAPGPAARNDLSALLQQWQPAARVLSATRLGWTDDSFTAFLLGDGRVIGDVEVVFQPDHIPAAAKELTSAGTLDDWKATVADPSVGNPLMVLSICHALTGPLLEPLGKDGGGFHLRGASSRGKSTLQRAAVSVWGSPRALHSWRATANGLEGIAAVANASLLALDEIGEISGKEASNAAYMLANGVGKARASRSGAARDPQRWRIALLSSGEISLADKIAEAGGRAAAGQEVRLLDLVADDRPHGAFDTLHGSPDGAAFADRLREATATNYGTLGPAFVEALIAKGDSALDDIKADAERFRQQALTNLSGKADGQVERAISRFGLAAAAGEFASRKGLTGWQTGTAFDAALACFKAWLANRGGEQPQEARDAIARVRDFVTKYEHTRFQVLGATDSERSLYERAGWRDPEYFYFSTDGWKDVHKGADPARAARYLRDAGLLQPGDGNNLAVRAFSINGSRPRVYMVRIAIMGAGDA